MLYNNNQTTVKESSMNSNKLHVSSFFRTVSLTNNIEDKHIKMEATIEDGVIDLIIAWSSGHILTSSAIVIENDCKFNQVYVLF